MEKFKKEVYEELPKLLEVVKAGAIEKEMGVSSGWISMRLNKHQNGKYSIRQFNMSDIEKLNKGMWQLAKKISNINIPYSEDRTTCIKNLKASLKSLFIFKLAEDKMKWTEYEFKIRMMASQHAKYRPQLTEDDLQQLSIGAREVAMRMLSIEYILKED